MQTVCVMIVQVRYRRGKTIVISICLSLSLSLSLSHIYIYIYMSIYTSLYIHLYARLSKSNAFLIYFLIFAKILTSDQYFPSLSSSAKCECSPSRSSCAASVCRTPVACPRGVFPPTSPPTARALPACGCFHPELVGVLHHPRLPVDDTAVPHVEVTASGGRSIDQTWLDCHSTRATMCDHLIRRQGRTIVEIASVRLLFPLERTRTPSLTSRRLPPAFRLAVCLRRSVETPPHALNRSVTPVGLVNRRVDHPRFLDRVFRGLWLRVFVRPT